MIKVKFFLFSSITFGRYGKGNPGCINGENYVCIAERVVSPDGAYHFFPDFIQFPDFPFPVQINMDEDVQASSPLGRINVEPGEPVFFHKRLYYPVKVFLDVLAGGGYQKFPHVKKHLTEKPGRYKNNEKQGYGGIHVCCRP